MKKKAVSLVLVGSVLCSLSAGIAGATNVGTFSDVTKGDWFYQYVDFVSGKDYMVGVGDNRFAPNESVTRGMFVTILAKMAGVTVDNQVSPFEDVKAGAWYAGAVKWAADNGIVAGESATTFSPDKAITREQMCTIMNKFVTYYSNKTNQTAKLHGSTANFLDEAKISSYALEAVTKCRAWGLVDGFADGNFYPQQTATRAQVAVVASQLSWLVNSTSSSSGSVVTPDQVSTKNYNVQTDLTVPGSAAPYTLVTDPYTVTTKNGTTSGDKNLSEVSKDLVSGTENQNKLTNLITVALNKAKDTQTTQQINGQNVTLNVDKDGKISASAPVRISDLDLDTQSGKTKARALKAASTTQTVTTEEINALLDKLQNNTGSTTLTDTDLAALTKVIEKADQLKGMSDEDIQAAVDKYVDNDETLKGATKGLTAENIRDAAEIYSVQLKVIQEEAEQAGQDADGNVVVTLPEQPVELIVQVDLGDYLTEAETLYQDKKAAALNAFATALYDNSEGKNFKYTEMQAAARTAAEAIYDLNAPSAFVTNNGDGTLSLLTAEQYYDLLVNNVNAISTLWTALDENESFYTAYLDKVKSSIDGSDTGKKLALTYAWHEDLAKMLGEKGGILDGNAGEKLLEITYDAAADDYDDLLLLVTSHLSGDQSSVIPGTMPEQLSKLLGSYTLTITIKETE